MKTSEILQSVLDVGKYLADNPQKPITNADHIRSLSDEELARYLSNVEMYAHEHGVKNVATWLQRLQKEWGK